MKYEMTDRELDLEVATKVMGWKLGPPHEIMGYMAHGSVIAESWEGSTKDNLTRIKDSFRPSTKIADAWLVVDAMRDMPAPIMDGFLWELHKQASAALLIPWPDVFWRITPEAICRAALQAVGASVAK